MAIWQDLVDDHGFVGRYASVRRFVLTLRGAVSPEARVVITTAPGEEGQVDYGDGPMVRYPQTGKYRRTRLFVLTLGYSAKPYGCWCGTRARRSGLNCMSARFVVSAARSTSSCSTTSRKVSSPRTFTIPHLIRSTAMCSPTMASSPLPCRVGDPDRKGKVEANNHRSEWGQAPSRSPKRFGSAPSFPPRAQLGRRIESVDPSREPCHRLSRRSPAVTKPNDHLREQALPAV
jgi:hypothetical protein